MKLYVLMSVYLNDKSEYVDKCLKSIIKSSYLPDKIIIIQDGPVTDETEKVLEKYKQETNLIFHKKIEKNSGLAVALNNGLEFCDCDIIYRMDADDVMHPDRIKLQFDFLMNNPEIDIVGGYISEIDETDKVIKDVVKYPLTHEGCFAFFKYRDCFAHPAVAIRKSFFDSVGKYSEKHINNNKNEDTNLWFRGFLAGKKYANIPNVILYFRRAAIFYNRRSGIKRAFSIFKDRLQMNHQLRYGISGFFSALIIFTFQLLPHFIKKFFYQYAR